MLLWPLAMKKLGNRDIILQRPPHKCKASSARLPPSFRITFWPEAQGLQRIATTAGGIEEADAVPGSPQAARIIRGIRTKEGKNKKKKRNRGYLLIE